MNKQDFIKSNNEIDYIAYSSYLELSLLQKDENLKKAIQSNINFQKHSSELEGENVLLKEEKKQLIKYLEDKIKECQNDIEMKESAVSHRIPILSSRIYTYEDILEKLQQAKGNSK